MIKLAKQNFQIRQALSTGAKLSQIASVGPVDIFLGGFALVEVFMN